MANIRMMLVIILGTLFLSSCGMSRTGEGLTFGSPTQQDTDIPERQNAGSLAQQNAGSPAQQELSTGIANYGNENLKLSMQEIHSALRSGLNSKHDQVLAHKYLAFIYCVSKRKRQCRNEFRKVLEIDPSFNLKPEEAGHPIWGPVFRVEKARYAKITFARSEH